MEHRHDAGTHEHEAAAAAHDCCAPAEHAHAEHAPHAEHDHADHGAHHDDDPHAGHHDHADHGGHQDHRGHAGHAGHADVFRRRFWIMLALAIPVVACSHGFAMLLGYPLPDAAWFGWISPLLGTVVYVWGAWPFLTGGVQEIRARRPGMMLLIALAITVAFVASWGASLGLLDHALDFWWELALLVVIMLLGHWIEMRSLARTTSALDALAALLPDEAEVVHGDHVMRVAPSALRVGQIVLVRPGGRVPADGRVVAGAADLDESMITGESRPVPRAEGDPVVAGTIATDSAIRVEVTAVGDDTALAGIRRLVADAQASSSHAQRLADRAAGWLFWFALGSAVVTMLVWWLVGLPDDGVMRAITVLVIACPHALGLAIPLVVAIATERAARAGILVRDRLALERMRAVDTVVFDKTGTLTLGSPRLTAIATAGGVDEAEALRLAAAAEAESEHPLARAIVAAAAERALAVPSATAFTASPALGVAATVDGTAIRVGGPRLLDEAGMTALPIAAEWDQEGATVLHVFRDGEIVAALRLEDGIRPESAEAVASLRARGREVVLMTGDAEPVAERVARELGIERVLAGLRPEDKSAGIAVLQAEGRVVAMVGDGVNDAPALARADVGIAIGAGTDVAIGSAGVILASSDPRGVASVIELSDATTRKMRQNLWWAAGYNLITVPLAAGVLAPIGFTLPMAVGAILMSVSTIVVAANAQLLRRLDLRPGHGEPANEKEPHHHG